MTVTKQSLSSVLRQVLALAAVILASIPQDSVPASARWFLGSGGVLILAVEHFVGDPSTGTTQAPTPAPPANVIGPPVQPPPAAPPAG
jgi:hypothetical protein